MRILFQEELAQIADELDEMARLIQEEVYDAGKALLDEDLHAAQRVIEVDKKIDVLQINAAEQCVAILAKQSPVATDLRTVISALLLTNTLERIGDLARHIAEIARNRYPQTALVPSVREYFVQFQKNAEQAAVRIRELLQTRDLEIAQAIERDDDIMDDLNTQVHQAMLSDAWVGTTQQTMDTVLLARFYERLGDHAVSVAHRLQFMVSGDYTTRGTSSISGVYGAYNVEDDDTLSTQL